MFLEHLEELKNRLVRVFITVGIIVALSFSLTIRSAEVNGYLIYYPFPNPFRNIAALALAQLQKDLVPSYVQLIVTTPAAALIALFYISIFMGIIFGMPMIIFQLGKFISPGLYAHEKKMVLKMIIPASILFVGGVFFSYFYVVPFTIDFLYRYALAIDIITFMTIDSFISFVLMFLLAFGICFQLPLIMYGLTTVGVVESGFWKDNFRYAAVAICIFGAAITPDGSGITMWLVAVPMIVLYAAGYLASKHVKKG
jgi:sec-independent protein translocase protein TatC